MTRYNLTTTDGRTLCGVVVQGAGGAMSADGLAVEMRRAAAGKAAGSPGAADGHLATYPAHLFARGEHSETMAARVEVPLAGLRWEVAS